MFEFQYQATHISRCRYCALRYLRLSFAGRCEFRRVCCLFEHMRFESIRALMSVDEIDRSVSIRSIAIGSIPLRNMAILSNSQDLTLIETMSLSEVEGGISPASPSKGYIHSDRAGIDDFAIAIDRTALQPRLLDNTEQTLIMTMALNVRLGDM